MSAPTNPRPNPYVGPRAFLYDERLWGRDREIAELVDLLIAERIVLLFSPSGAGKSSLLEAGVRKALERERFQVLPTIRVASPIAARAVLPRGANPYVASALLSIDAALPSSSLFDEDAEAAVADLAALDRLPPARNEDGSAQPMVFIFDQFEEVLTLNPADQDLKEAFFAQVGRALRDRNRWAIFAMREEYVAGLDPYLRPIPTRLGTRYRLDLLGPAAALDAIRQPALAQGVDFTEAAARTVIDDLRRIKVARVGGGPEETLGPHVEPVQLQVVCRRVWHALAPAATTIEAGALHGNAQEALTAYYDETLRDVAEAHGVDERRLRDWFGRELMTAQGLRAQVAQDAEETAAIRDAVAPLLAAHLIREETRRGGTWYELSHDRLAAPVRESNQRWYREHASSVERRAALWDQSGRRTELLLQEPEIDDAEAWGRANPARLTDRVNAFLLESRRAALEHATRRTRGLAALAVGVAMAIAIVAGLWLSLQRTETELVKAENARLQAEADRQKADEAAAALEKTVKSAGELVQRQYSESGRAADDPPVKTDGGQTTLDPDPGDPSKRRPAKVDPTESLKAQIALRRYAPRIGGDPTTTDPTVVDPTTTQARPTRAATIMYYTRDRADSKVVRELERLGFAFSLQPSRRSLFGANCIWYGRDVPVDEVKVVALALLRAGIGLQVIKRFEDPSDKRSTIEIGNRGAAGLAEAGVLSVEDVERLSARTPELIAKPVRSQTTAPAPAPAASPARVPRTRAG